MKKICFVLNSVYGYAWGNVCMSARAHRYEKKALESSGARIISNWEPSGMFWDPNSGPVQEQYVLLDSKPSTQPPYNHTLQIFPGFMFLSCGFIIYLASLLLSLVFHFHR